MLAHPTLISATPKWFFFLSGVIGRIEKEAVMITLHLESPGREIKIPVLGLPSIGQRSSVALILRWPTDGN